MKLFGLQKLSLIDYPEKMCATVFTGGCNYRCPFCHNSSLVLTNSTEKADSEFISEEELIEFLSGRKKVLDGVCITGGEPTLYGDELVALTEKIKKMGYSVKLDTNGTRPDVIRQLVQRGLVDYVAMDIKNSKSKYLLTAGVSDAKIENVCESTNILMTSDIDFEFRTTVVKPLHTKEDFAEIAKWLKGEEKYYIQSYKDSGDILAHRRDGKTELGSYSEQELEEFVSVLRLGGIPNAFLREIK